MLRFEEPPADDSSETVHVSFVTPMAAWLTRMKLPEDHKRVNNRKNDSCLRNNRGSEQPGRVSS